MNPKIKKQVTEILIQFSDMLGYHDCDKQLQAFRKAEIELMDIINTHVPDNTLP